MACIEAISVQMRAMRMMAGRYYLIWEGLVDRYDLCIRERLFGNPEGI